jgi:DNA-binding NtrC family response regulator
MDDIDQDGSPDTNRNHRRSDARPWRATRLGCRREEVPSLAAAYLAEARERNGSGPLDLHPDSGRLLAALPWHGSTAEFRFVLDRLVSRGDSRTLNVEDVLGVVEIGSVRVPGAGETLREATRRFEREFIAATIERHEGKVEPAARALGLRGPNLHRKLRTLGLRRRRG